MSGCHTADLVERQRCKRRLLGQRTLVLRKLLAARVLGLVNVKKPGLTM